MAPWWWLSPADCRRLGLGEGAEKSERGVVFGDAGARLRLELVPSSDEGPVRLGPLTLRLWGESGSPRARATLALAARLLGSRRMGPFDRAEAEPLLGAMAEGPRAARVVVDVPSACERACVFCHVSARPLGERVPHGSTEAALRAIDAATGPVLLTGDDVLSHPDIVSLVARAAAGGREVTAIGPPRAGLTARLAPPLARAGLSRWVTGCFGPDEASHDRVVGLAGALASLVEAAAAMRAAGVEVELVTLLARPVLPTLAETVARARQIAPGPVTLLAYAPDPVVGEAFDAVVPGFDELRQALASVDHLDVALDAQPLCVLPPSRLSSASTRLERSDEGLEPRYPQESCGGCSARGRCPGVTPTVLRATGGRGLRAM